MHLIHRGKGAIQLATSSLPIKRLHINYPIGRFYGFLTMRHHNFGNVEKFQVFINRTLVFHIQMACRFVKEQDFR